MPAAVLLAKVLEAGISFTIVVLFFASIFKLVPNVEIGWNDVWMGALLTAVLFTAGKLATGWYLEQSGIGSPFGATESILVVLAWVYYSSQILFFGAEFTKIYAGQRRITSEAGRGQ
jgi:membrane protein